MKRLRPVLSLYLEYLTVLFLPWPDKILMFNFFPWALREIINASQSRLRTCYGMCWIERNFATAFNSYWLFRALSFSILPKGNNLGCWNQYLKCPQSRVLKDMEICSCFHSCTSAVLRGSASENGLGSWFLKYWVDFRDVPGHEPVVLNHLKQ